MASPRQRMSNSTIAPPPGTDESGWVATLFPNSGHARLLKVMTGIFLAAGIFGFADRVATISADLHESPSALPTHTVTVAGIRDLSWCEIQSHASVICGGGL